MEVQLVQRGNSNIVNGHLKGAMTIMKTEPQVITPTSLFLERVRDLIRTQLFSYTDEHRLSVFMM